MSIGKRPRLSDSEDIMVSIRFKVVVRMDIGDDEDLLKLGSEGDQEQKEMRKSHFEAYQYLQYGLFQKTK